MLVLFRDIRNASSNRCATLRRRSNPASQRAK
jgi:hypothetical protein